MAAGSEESKIFTLAEVASHNKHDDCWLIINGKVYDVTKFLDDHPGGDDVLISATGKDATDDFEDVGHSSSAKKMMAEYIVGSIDTASIASKVSYSSSTKPDLEKQDKSSEFFVKVLQFLIPLAILGLAFGIRFYTKLIENPN